MNSEKALLNFFIGRLEKVDSDLIVGHDLHGYQMNLLAQRLTHHQIASFSKLGRVKRSVLHRPTLERTLFVGRLVCDVKISAKELIRCRSYDLDALCQSVLKLQDGHRVDLEADDVPKMFQRSSDILKLVSLTMQDAGYILKIMHSLNVVPLALQITSIAGNVMSRTLLGGRSERNEFLLLHAFAEKDYIVPDKVYKKKEDSQSTAARKKPTYSGGLVLEPKVGYYDKLVLLMDFNSLYPSIIQEYNLCFTTTDATSCEEFAVPSGTAAPGILPTEIRKLVESRREVKKLMNNSDISPELKMQYHIRQMALKLTANSMYGCLGFSNSRFYAKHLAALITQKGREILTNTKELVERMNFEVIYGDTDSLMINSNITEYEQVFQIGGRIKQEVNKSYRHVELDIDGVFKHLLLLKKKKYAAVSLSRAKNGTLHSEMEFKGLEIVRRDCARLAAEAGRFVLRQILSEQPADERNAAIFDYLRKLKEELEAKRVPLSLLVMTKQLNKDPKLYSDGNSQPHVQVALRYNSRFGGHFRAGDTVSYLICEDGTGNPHTQRAYHVEELKNSEDGLRIDVRYYVEMQIYPVVSRIFEPMEQMDMSQLIESLGLDLNLLKVQRKQEGSNATEPEVKFRNVDKFAFRCLSCKSENQVEGPMLGHVPVLAKCQNWKCQARPADYVGYVQNQMMKAINGYIDKYYLYEMYCEDPLCTKETTRMPMAFAGRFPICPACKNSILLKKYTESNLYTQLNYFQYIFDLTKLSSKPVLEYQVEKAYHEIKETVDKRLKYSAFSVVDLSKIYSLFSLKGKEEEEVSENRREVAKQDWDIELSDFEDDEF